MKIFDYHETDIELLTTPFNANCIMQNGSGKDQDRGLMYFQYSFDEELTYGSPYAIMNDGMLVVNSLSYTAVLYAQIRPFENPHDVYHELFTVILENEDLLAISKINSKLNAVC